MNLDKTPSSERDKQLNLLEKQKLGNPKPGAQRLGNSPTLSRRFPPFHAEVSWFDCRMAFSRAMRRLPSTRPGVTLRQAAFAAVSRRLAAESAATRTSREARLPANGETSLRERLRCESKHIQR
jgi:hypothetical protein